VLVTGVPNRFLGSTAIPSFCRVKFRNCGIEWVLMTGVPKRFRGSTTVPSFRRIQFRNCGTKRDWWQEFPIGSAALPRFSTFAQGTVSELRHQSRIGSSSLQVFKGTDPVLLGNWKVHSVLFRYRMGTDTVLEFFTRDPSHVRKKVTQIYSITHMGLKMSPVKLEVFVIFYFSRRTSTPTLLFTLAYG